MSDVSSPGTDLAPCPACGKATRGRFCSHCGAMLAPAACAQCDALLQPGDKYCFECGAKVLPPDQRVEAVSVPAGTPAGPDDRRVAQVPVGDDADDDDEAVVVAAPRGNGTKLAWLIGTGAVIAVIGIATWRSMKDEQFAGTAAQAAASVGMPQGGAGAADAGNPLAMDPLQQADRMYDRVMRLASEGKKDSVQFFAPIAFQIYQSLGPLDADQHYDFGNVAHTAGLEDVAAAHADTILAKDPTHLLGLALRMRAAAAAGQTSAAKAAAAKLLAAEKSEMAKAEQKTEYQRHSSDITMALEEAKKLNGVTP